MLPPVALASLTTLTTVDVLVVIPVEIIVVVDVDVAVVPIAIAPVTAPSTPSGGAQRNSGAPRESCAWHIARISVGVVRILSRSSSVNNRWVV
jgi:hypothetical protein